MLVIGWHGELEVTEGDGGVAESDAEHLSYPLSNRALSCPLAIEIALRLRLGLFAAGRGQGLR